MTRRAAVMDPRFASFAIYEHCMPFNVSRAYDEAKRHRSSGDLDRGARPRHVGGAARLSMPASGGGAPLGVLRLRHSGNGLTPHAARR